MVYDDWRVNLLAQTPQPLAEWTNVCRKEQTMLILTRNIGEVVMIGDDIAVAGAERARQ